MKRQSETNKEKLFRFDQEYSKKYKSPLIKWFQTTLTPEEKFKLGLMTYPEYEEWQKQLADKAATDSSGDTNNVPNATPVSDGATFWADDTCSRETISADAYDDFLAQNNVSVGNAATVDVNALLEEHGEQISSPDPDIDEILANVNRDIHGGNTVLSADEIAAMFEAANGNKP